MAIIKVMWTKEFGLFQIKSTNNRLALYFFKWKYWSFHFRVCTMYYFWDHFGHNHHKLWGKFCKNLMVCCIIHIWENDIFKKKPYILKYKWIHSGNYIIWLCIGANNHQHGDRIPALFIRYTNKLFFCMSVRDNHNYHWNFSYQLNQNYFVKIEQNFYIQSGKLMHRNWWKLR